MLWRQPNLVWVNAVFPRERRIAERVSTFVNKLLSSGNFLIRSRKLFSALVEHNQGLFELRQRGRAEIVVFFHTCILRSPSVRRRQKMVASQD